MRTSGALRFVAIAIGVAGAADPVWTVTRRAPGALVVTILDAPTLALPDGSTTRRVSAYDAANRIQRAVADLFDARIRSQSTKTDANPCPGEAACVLVSDGARPRRLSATGILGAVRVGKPVAPNVAIKHVRANARTHANASSVIEVALERNGVTRSPTNLQVFDGDVLVGEGSGSRVEWTPIQAGVRELRVVVSTAANEITSLDNEARIAVEVLSQPDDVLLYEPQPTWSGTFVRRALEEDPRFRVRTRVRVGTSIDVSTVDVPLDPTTLERSNTRAVLVTAAEGLTSHEVGMLEQFMRVRGGSVVLLLDRPFDSRALAQGGPASGPVRRLLPFAISEHREDEPVQIGPLKATEFLTFGPADAVTTVLLTASSGPAVVSRPFGNGRLVVSGLVDAWRFRHENGAFARFWQAVVAGAADAAGDVLTVTANEHVAEPGERVRIDVEWRPLRAVEQVEAQASMNCGGTAKRIRLLPAGVPGRFDGEIVAAAPGACRIDARVNEFTASTPLLVHDVPHVAEVGDDELSVAVLAHGGTVVTAGNEGELITKLRQPASSSDMSSQVRPLRSPWWIVPFAACLGGEWWLRRRNGLR